MSKRVSTNDTRAILLPVEGAPVSFMLPERVRDEMQPMGGGCMERVLEGCGEFGHVACYVNDRDAHADAFNTNIPAAMGLFKGPMIVVLESYDGAIRPVPAGVRPSQWHSLFHKKEKKKEDEF